jgi:ribose transport system substrate-binding protein
MRKRQMRVGFLVATAVSLAVVVSIMPFGAAASPKRAAADDIVAQAKAVVAAGTKGLVAAKNASKPELTFKITDFAPVKSWTGPKDKAIAPKGKKVVVISCATVAPACANLSYGAVNAAKALGWKATYLDGKASIQGYVNAFQTALNANPDAIVTVALPESQLQTYIAQAHEKGIPVVGITVTPEKISNPKGHYDSYVTFREDSNALLEAIWVIADSNGEAKVAFMWDKGYPFLVKQLAGEKRIFSQCSGCKIVDTVYREFATAANPVRMQQIATALLQRHPDIQYVICPYGLNCTSIALAAKALGRDIKVVSKNADPNNVAAVAKGLLASEVGSSTEWSGWSAIDDVVRLMNGKKPLGLAAHNVPLHYFVKSNAPANGKYDYGKIFDFRNAYLKLWGRQ